MTLVAPLADPAVIQAGVRHLCANGLPCSTAEFQGFPIEPATLETVVKVLLFQQVAAPVAAKRWVKFVRLCGGRFDAGKVVAGHVPLDKLGLPAARIGTLRELCQRSLDGSFRAPPVGTPADEARAYLEQFLGIGPWTSRMYAIFALGAPDVWPTDDVGLQRGYVNATGVRSATIQADMEARGESWKPYRSMAAWLLWLSSGIKSPGFRVANPNQVLAVGGSE